jgi:hypothetical protein
VIPDPYLPFSRLWSVSDNPTHRPSFGIDRR